MHIHTCHGTPTDSVMCFRNMHWWHAILCNSHSKDTLEKGFLPKYEQLTQIRSLKYILYLNIEIFAEVTETEKFRLCQQVNLSMCPACFPVLHFWTVTLFIQWIFMEHLLGSRNCANELFLWILSLSVRISGNSFKNVFLRKYSRHTLFH